MHHMIAEYNEGTLCVKINSQYYVEYRTTWKLFTTGYPVTYIDHYPSFRDALKEAKKRYNPRFSTL